MIGVFTKLHLGSDYFVMSWLTDFDKLNFSTKSIGISIAILLPFWLLSIYLLNRPLYDSKDYLIIGSFCFCFAVMWYAFNMAAALLYRKYDKEKVDLDASALVAGVGSASYLSIGIVASYYLEWSYRTFLIVVFSYMIFLVLRAVLLIRLRNRSINKRANS